MRARGGRKNGSAGTQLPVAKMKACVRAAHTTGTAEDARRWTLLARLLNAWLEETASTARATLAASERSDAAIEPGARLRFDEVWANFTSPLVTDGIVGRRRHGRGAHAADEETELMLRARELNQYFISAAEGELMVKLAMEAMADVADDGPVVFLEPSAGGGDIVKLFPRSSKVVGIDIDPRLAKEHGWLCADFLSLRGASDVSELHGIPPRNVCVVTSPPFNSNKVGQPAAASGKVGAQASNNDTLAFEFVRHAIQSFADTVVFLLPKRYASIDNWDEALRAPWGRKAEATTTTSLVEPPLPVPSPSSSEECRGIVEFRRATPVIKAHFSFCGAKKVVQPVFIGVLRRRGATGAQLGHAPRNVT